jgi:hypothetical protein
LVIDLLSGNEALAGGAYEAGVAVAAGRMLRAWTNPEYRIIEFSTPDVLEEDLRQLAQLGIGSEATETYLKVKR